MTEQTAARPAETALRAVRDFADTVLRHGRDVYGTTRTPLLVDGLNVETLEPASWKRDGETWVLSNLASQQHFMRVLDGLTALTEEPAYLDVAAGAIRHYYAHLRSENGLLYWGGHIAYDLAGDRLVEERRHQELKAHYPYYELMWRVDPHATKQMLEAIWEAHILDWSNLDMNRHGRYEVRWERPWQHEYVGGPVFFVGKGLTFCNTGSDLIYAGGLLHHLSGEAAPLVWAKRMAHRYVETRDAQTGLGGYQYSRIENDRAAAQFGPEFGERALEGRILDRGHAGMRYAVMGIAEMKTGERLGAAGQALVGWAEEDLRAYARHVYHAETNTFHALITDGTRLSPEDVKRPGYYRFPEYFAPWPADATHFWAYALAYRLTRRPEHWQMARNIARGLRLGDLEGAGAAETTETKVDAPHALLGLLELHRADSGDAAEGRFLTLAARVTENLLRTRYHRGFFLPNKQRIFAQIGAVEPLAVLRFVAAAQGRPDDVPDAWPATPYFQAPHDGLGRSRDTEVIYGRERSGGE